MKVALDEGVPERLAKYLPGHDVQTVRQLRLKGVKNGKLLAAIEAMAFEAFITNDKRMEAEGQLSGRMLGILVLSATNWPVILPYANRIATALNDCQIGTVTKIDYGRFMPRKFRKNIQP